MGAIQRGCNHTVTVYFVACCWTVVWLLGILQLSYFQYNIFLYITISSICQLIIMSILSFVCQSNNKVCSYKVQIQLMYLFRMVSHSVVCYGYINLTYRHYITLQHLLRTLKW